MRHAHRSLFSVIYRPTALSSPHVFRFSCSTSLYTVPGKIYSLWHQDETGAVQPLCLIDSQIRLCKLRQFNLRQVIWAC